MERVQGFINLSQIIKPERIVLPKKDGDLPYYDSDEYGIEIVKLSYTDRSIVISFIYDGEKYFWKYDGKANPYNELVVNELCNDLGIGSVSYDLAFVGKLKGTISKNYRQKGAKYITGEELLREYYNKHSIFDMHNNLEEIWIALEEKYKGRPDKEKIVKKIMDKLVTIFILDILVGQRDRHSGNWEIVETEDGSVDLSPIYDNIRILEYDYRALIAHLGMHVNSEVGNNYKDNLVAFFKESSSEFSSKLIESLSIISENNLREIFKRIERKIGYKIPKNYKNILINKLAEQADFIMKTYSETQAVSNKH